MAGRMIHAIYGASGCGRGILPVARSVLHSAGEQTELLFVDDRPSTATVNGHRVITYDALLAANASMKWVNVAVSDPRVRRQLVGKCQADGIQAFSVKASNVVIMDDVMIGEGFALSPFVTLTSNIRIGRHFHANLYSYVEHDCVIGDFVTFAPGVQCNGNVTIEDDVYIGAGAILKQGRPGVPLTIGRGAIVGMGAVVTRSVPPGAVVVGNPARPMSPKQDN